MRHSWGSTRRHLAQVGEDRSKQKLILGNIFLNLLLLLLDKTAPLNVRIH